MKKIADLKKLLILHNNMCKIISSIELLIKLPEEQMVKIVGAY
jgi:hypothetical protein